MALTNRIDRTIRFKVWEKIYDGYTVSQVAKLCFTSVEHVNGIIEDFRRAEKDAKRKLDESLILEDPANVAQYLYKKRFEKVDFVLLSNNEEINNLAKQLGFI